MNQSENAVALLLRRSLAEKAVDLRLPPDVATKVRNRHRRDARRRAVVGASLALVVVVAGVVVTPQLLPASGSTTVVPATVVPAASDAPSPVVQDEGDLGEGQEGIVSLEDPPIERSSPEAIAAAAAAVWSLPDVVAGVRVTWLPAGYVPSLRSEGAPLVDTGIRSTVASYYRPEEPRSSVTFEIDRSGHSLATEPDQEPVTVDGNAGYLTRHLWNSPMNMLQWTENGVTVTMKWLELPPDADVFRIAAGIEVLPVVEREAGVAEEVRTVIAGVFPDGAAPDATADVVASGVVGGEELRPAVEAAWRDRPGDMTNLTRMSADTAFVFLDGRSAQADFVLGIYDLWQQDPDSGDWIDLEPEYTPDPALVLTPVPVWVVRGDDGVWRVTRESYCAAMAPLVQCPPSS